MSLENGTTHSEYAEQGEEFDDVLQPGAELMIGLYTIEGFLAAGGFGITYLARNSLDRRVVIKECFPANSCRRKNFSVIPRSQAHRKELESIVRMFASEVTNLAKADHPNIVGVHQVWEENNTAYMALDYVQGRDLLEMLEEDPDSLKPDLVEGYLVKMLGAIGHVHKLGILHRDISPDNIIVNELGEPILIDFGAAREHEDNSTGPMKSALRVVKDGYSPQEYYTAGSEQTPSCDLYSLAASFYHIITRELPPDSQKRLSAFANGDADPYVSLGDKTDAYSQVFVEALDKAMAILPRDRMQSAEDWLTYLQSPPRQAAAAPAKPAAPVAQPKKKSRVPMLLAITALGGVAGAGYLYTQNPEMEIMGQVVGEVSASAQDDTTPINVAGAVHVAADPIVDDATVPPAVTPKVDDTEEEVTSNRVLALDSVAVGDDTPATADPIPEPVVLNVPETVEPASPEVTEEPVVADAPIVTQEPVVEEPALAEDVSQDDTPQDTVIAALSAPEVVEVPAVPAPAAPEVAETPAPVVDEPPAPLVEDVALADEPEVIETPQAEVTEAPIEEPKVAVEEPEVAVEEPEVAVEEPEVAAVAPAEPEPEVTVPNVDTSNSVGVDFFVALAEKNGTNRSSSTPTQPTQTANAPSFEMRDVAPLPFALSRWQPGVVSRVQDSGRDALRVNARIVSVDGTDVQSNEQIQTLIADLADQTQANTVEVPIGVKFQPNGPTFDRTLTIEKKPHLILPNGLHFEAVETEDGWKTQVAQTPEESNFQIGDQLVSYAASWEALDGPNTLQTILEREIANGQTSLSFAVNRDGEIWIEAFLLTPDSN